MPYIEYNKNNTLPEQVEENRINIKNAVETSDIALSISEEVKKQINEIELDTLKKVYPIGSIYISINSTNPAEIFSGTWERIKDRFLLACGDSYRVGDTGGEITHTLTINEMPRHNHGFLATNWTDGTNGFSISKAGSAYPNQASFNVGADWGENGNIRIEYTGSSQSHNNMPPYLAVYIWKRIA